VSFPRPPRLLEWRFAFRHRRGANAAPQTLRFGGNCFCAPRSWRSTCRGALKVGQRALKMGQTCAKWDCADFAEAERSGGGAKLALAPVGGVGLAA
jgi:hypothetical protein